MWYRCTAIYGVPTMFIDMLCSHEFDKVDLSSLRTGIMAGSPCPIETMKEVRDKMHLDKMTVSETLYKDFHVLSGLDRGQQIEHKFRDIFKVR